MALRMYAVVLTCLCTCAAAQFGYVGVRIPPVITLGRGDDLPEAELIDMVEKFISDTGLAAHCINQGNKAVALENRARIASQRNHLILSSAAFAHLRLSNRRNISPFQRQKRNQRHQAAIFYTQAFKAILSRLGLTRSQTKFLQTLRLRNVGKDTLAFTLKKYLEDQLGACPTEYSETSNIECDPNGEDKKFRRIDGSCNNLANPQFGMAGQPFERFVPAEYENDEGSPRVTSFGRPLPNARAVSLKLHSRSDDTNLDSTISHLVMQWGQVMDHDLTLAPMTESDGGEPLVCCVEDVAGPGLLPREERVLINEEEFFTQPFCTSIPIAEDDEFLGARTCQAVVRSAPAPVVTSKNKFCGSAPREQFNVLTHFVDGSQVYGSEEEEARHIRTANGLGAELLIQSTKFEDSTRNQTLLPPREREECVLEEEDNCFVAGEERVNEHPALASMHTLLVREHNRIARELRRAYAWRYLKISSEELFQKTRQIVIAQIQAVTYREFLPIIIDAPLRQRLSLNLGRDDTLFRGYNERLNPAIRNEFATAAFRLGHTLINQEFRRVASDGRPFGSILLNENFERVATIFEKDQGGPDSILRGLLSNPAQTFDRKATPAVRDNLFQNLDNTTGLGMDLFALNSQRGRDHGIPSYVEFLRLCNADAPIPKSFNDLNFHDVETRKILASFYDKVEDIDLFPAIISETPLGTGIRGKGIAGPTIQCMVGRQFEIAKKGDRFFFESDVAGTERFTTAQINEIRNKASLSTLLCENAQITSIQPNAFLLPTVRGNGLRSCGSISKINLDLFL